MGKDKEELKITGTGKKKSFRRRESLMVSGLIIYNALKAT
jgi:hypothetical protein